MNDLPEDQFDKAARILKAARELLTSRGAKAVTMSDVAQKAYVGKGTVYLYWPTKEDLLVGLIGRDLLAVVDSLLAELSADPGIARPDLFCSLVFRTMSARPLVVALNTYDRDLLGVLVEHPRAIEIADVLGPRTLLGAMIPAWRRHGMATTDWDEQEQILGLHALTVGITESTLRPLPQFHADYDHVYRRCITALLGPATTDAARVTAAASDISSILRAGHAAALALLTVSPARESR